ncbi:MAG: GNAT family N-acetyltransferase [Eubacteriales bacterium]
MKINNDIIIKEATPKDAVALIDYINVISDESDFLTFGCGEFNITIKEEEKILEEYLTRNNAIYIIATYEDKIVGSLNFSGGTRPRISHKGEFGVSVLKGYWGNGIGTALIKYLINWAEQSGVIKKINLKVREDNVKAISIYKKLSFVEEGRITREFLIDKVYYNSLIMGYEID